MDTFAKIAAGIVTIPVVGVLSVILYTQFKEREATAEEANYHECLKRGHDDVLAHGLGKLGYLKSKGMSDSDVIEAVCGTAATEAFKAEFDFAEYQHRYAHKVRYTPPDTRTNEEKMRDCQSRGYDSIKTADKNGKFSNSEIFDSVDWACRKNTENFK